MYHIHLHRGLVYLFSHSQLGTTTDSLTSPPPMMMMMTAADSSPHDDDDDLGISRWRLFHCLSTLWAAVCSLLCFARHMCNEQGVSYMAIIYVSPPPRTIFNGTTLISLNVKERFLIRYVWSKNMDVALRSCCRVALRFGSCVIRNDREFAPVNI